MGGGQTFYVWQNTCSFYLTALALLFSGCSSPDVLPSQLRGVPPAAAESIVTHYLSKYAADFQLEPRPQGGTRAIAEAYLQRYQPGPEPRVFPEQHRLRPPEPCPGRTV